MSSAAPPPAPSSFPPQSQTAREKSYSDTTTTKTTSPASSPSTTNSTLRERGNTIPNNSFYHAHYIHSLSPHSEAASFLPLSSTDRPQALAACIILTLKPQPTVSSCCFYHSPSYNRQRYRHQSLAQYQRKHCRDQAYQAQPRTHSNRPIRLPASIGPPCSTRQRLATPPAQPALQLN